MNVINTQKKKTCFNDTRLGDLIEYDNNYFLVVQDVQSSDSLQDSYNVMNVKTGLGYWIADFDEIILYKNAKIDLEG